MATPDDDLKRFRALLSRSSLGSEAAQSLIKRASPDEVARAIGGPGIPNLSLGRIKPLEDHLIVQAVEAEQTTDYGLVFPTTSELREGEVRAVGPGRWSESASERVPMDVKAGDLIIYSKYSGTKVRSEGSELQILSAKDVIAVVQDSTANMDRSALEVGWHRPPSASMQPPSGRVRPGERVTVVTQDDQSLGHVGQVYLDDHTGEPSWIFLKTGWFGTNETIVPLEGAELTDDGKLRVAHTKETIKDAPNVDADNHLSTKDQDEFFRYYSGAGMDVSRYGGRGDVGDRASHPAGRHDDDQIIGGDAGRRDNDREGSMTLHEEQVDVGTEQVETGRVGLRKHVRGERRTAVTARAFSALRRAAAALVTDQKCVTGPVQREDETEVTLHVERPVTDKDVVATERVWLEKETVTDEQQVVTDVSHEEVNIDRGRRVDWDDRDF